MGSADAPRSWRRCCAPVARAQRIAPTTARQIHVPNNKIFTLSGVSAAQACRVLNLTGNRVTDLHPLQTMPCLEILNLSANGLRDVRPLSRVTTLRVLNLSDNKLTQPPELAALRELRSLDLARNMLADLKGAARLLPTSLSTLDISANRIGHVRPPRAPVLSASAPAHPPSCCAGARPDPAGLPPAPVASGRG